MEKMTRLDINCSTGEVQEIELTAEEIALIEKNAADREKELAAQALEAQAKAEAKASALAKLAALGLTEEEAAAIAG